MHRITSWWESSSLGVKLFVGALAAIALWLLWAFAFIRLVLWYWTGSSIPTGADGTQLAQLGQIGDLFGGINALFAAFAFVGVALAAYYQHKAFKLQAEQHVRQSFEPLFFQLLQAHRAPATLIAVNARATPDSTYALSACMKVTRAAMDEAIFNSQRGDPTSPPPLHVVTRLYRAFYSANDGELAPYFRKLYHLFKFIAHGDLRWDEKVRYANIARASLNKDELLLLLLNCASEEGAEFKPLVEGLGLLKHLPAVTSIEKDIAGQCYSLTAFMQSSDRAKFWMHNPSKRPHWAKDAPL